MSGDVPGPDVFGNGIISIPIALSDPHLPYSYCYAIPDANSDVHLIDPGMDSDANLGALILGLALGGFTLEMVKTVFVSHLHPDHLGLASRVRTISGARVAMSRIEQEAITSLPHRSIEVPALLDTWGVPPERREEMLLLGSFRRGTTAFLADDVLEDGEPLAIPGRAIDAILTPGHTAGHLCFVDRDDSILFSGDHVLPVIYPGIGLGSVYQPNPIGDYLDSLDAISRLDDFEVAPGHWFRFRGLAERSEQIRSHHLRRSEEVRAQLMLDPSSTVWAVAERLTWTAGWANLRGFYAYSALLQTEMHVAYLSRLGATFGRPPPVLRE